MKHTWNASESDMCQVTVAVSTHQETFSLCINWTERKNTTCANVFSIFHYCLIHICCLCRECYANPIYLNCLAAVAGPCQRHLGTLANVILCLQRIHSHKGCWCNHQQDCQSVWNDAGGQRWSLLDANTSQDWGDVATPRRQSRIACQGTCVRGLYVCLSAVYFICHSAETVRDSYIPSLSCCTYIYSSLLNTQCWRRTHLSAETSRGASSSV
jgi:hypothetical protein